MRKKIVAANWKMNLGQKEGADLVNNILAGLPNLEETKQVVISPTFVHIAQTATQLVGHNYINLAAQNCHTEASGAYTGEIAAGILKSFGVNYVILGHSERREYFKETSEMLVKKVNQTLANNMKAIFCCGELEHIVIAYEPIWAIGTGRTASSAQAQDMHQHIRTVIATQFGKTVAENMSILYGGSCKPSNAAELFACPDVDGGLIGGASLKADECLGIIKAMF